MVTNEQYISVYVIVQDREHGMTKYFNTLFHNITCFHCTIILYIFTIWNKSNMQRASPMKRNKQYRFTLNLILLYYLGFNPE